MSLHQETGHRLGEAAALSVLSVLRAADPVSASSARHAARAIVRESGASQELLTWPGWEFAPVQADLRLNVRTDVIALR